MRSSFVGFLKSMFVARAFIFSTHSTRKYISLYTKTNTTHQIILIYLNSSFEFIHSVWQISHVLSFLLVVSEVRTFYISKCIHCFTVSNVYRLYIWWICNCIMWYWNNISIVHFIRKQTNRFFINTKANHHITDIKKEEQNKNKKTLYKLAAQSIPHTMKC